MANSSADKATNESIFAILEPVVAEAGLFLEEVKLVKAGKYTSVRVTVDLIDGPGGVDSTTLGDITRDVSAALDDADPIPGAYTLEVSTPGADRVLTEARHFSRSQGRLVDITLIDGSSIHGRIINIDDGKVSVRTEGDDAIGDQSIKLSEINSAKVVVELRKMNQESEGD